MVTGWRFLALAGSIFLAAVFVVRGVLALLDRRRMHHGDSVTEQWLAKHRVTCSGSSR